MPAMEAGITNHIWKMEDLLVPETIPAKDDPTFMVGIIRAKLNNYNPDAPNPEVLHSAEGTLNAVKARCGAVAEMPKIAGLFVTVHNHLISLLANLEPGGSAPNLAQVREAALSALADLGNEIVQHQSV